MLFVGKGTSDKWKAFKSELMRVQGQHVSGRVKGQGVTKKVDDGGVIDVVYMDISKAFDKVPHDKAVKKAFGMLAFIGWSIEYMSLVAAVQDVDEATFGVLRAVLITL
eukprot:g30154.t1